MTRTCCHKGRTVKTLLHWQTAHPIFHNISKFGREAQEVGNDGKQSTAGEVSEMCGGTGFG